MTELPRNSILQDISRFLTESYFSLNAALAAPPGVLVVVELKMAKTLKRFFVNPVLDPRLLFCLMRPEGCLQLPIQDLVPVGGELDDAFENLIDDIQSQTAILVCSR